jgi:hypothetical protein
MVNQLSPIVIFTYKKLDTLMSLIASLNRCLEADYTDLFIFSDGPKNDSDIEKIVQVRDYIKQINGFKSVTYFFSETNKGLAASIINGVTHVFQYYKSVIVLEDDLVVAQNFLTFMNQALVHYENNPQIYSISGYSSPVKGLGAREIYFTQRASSWGWATWKNRWEIIDWEVKDYSSFSKSKTLRRKFNKMGSDMAGMLDRQMKNQINSWAIRWCYHQFKYNLYTVFPAVSKVVNNGFSRSDATHTREKFNRFNTKLDDSNNVTFNFKDEIVLDRYVIKKFTRPYSISQRVIYKILNKF